MGNITSLVNSRRRVGFGTVKKYFTKLFNKVIKDFFIIIKQIITNKYKKDLIFNNT